MKFILKIIIKINAQIQKGKLFFDYNSPRNFPLPVKNYTFRKLLKVRVEEQRLN